MFTTLCQPSPSFSMMTCYYFFSTLMTNRNQTNYSSEWLVVRIVDVVLGYKHRACFKIAEILGE